MKQSKKIVTIEIETARTNTELKTIIEKVLKGYIFKIIQIQVNKIK